MKTAIHILSAAMTPVPVSARMPKVRPQSFVRVDRVGGRQPNPVTDVARILVECWAPDMATAESMSATASKALHDASGTVQHTAFVRYYGNEAGPMSYDDPDVTDQRRWLFHGDLSISTTGIVEGS